MKAVLIGGTGLTGSAVLDRLLEDSAVTQVISVARRRTGVASPKLVEVLIPDLDSLANVRERLRGNLYFNCLGTTIRKAGSQAAFRAIDHEAALAFARIAKVHGAQSFVSISAMGANENSRFFYNRVKGELDRDLRKLGFPALTIFRPALLIGERKEVRNAERVFIQLAKPVLKVIPQIWGRKIATDVNRLAERMVQVAKTSQDFQIIGASEI